MLTKLTVDSPLDSNVSLADSPLDSTTSLVDTILDSTLRLPSSVTSLCVQVLQHVSKF
jgi:hypothetical protein